MKYYRFKALKQKDFWLENAFVGCDDKGIIQHIGQDKPVNGPIHWTEAYAIPAFQNAHSHAFQYQMAGLAEIHKTGSEPDDFWSWREAMYKIALNISPDEMQKVATRLYKEMRRHGYSQVAEFHYLHHQPSGLPYENVAEMGSRLVAAAQEAGIKITLVPMFYKNGGFGQEPSEGQRRFISKDVDAYEKLLIASENAINHYEGASLGFGFHSLRAVDEQSMRLSLKFSGNKPIHIHISEQLKEVDDCLGFYGKHPVEWLLKNFEVSEQWHLVHATHLTDHELNGIAQSRAQVVLCPSTEGNLGDGIFRLRDYIKAEGRWSIGTDSHVGLDPKEELRILDYGQRLISHKRNTFYTKKNGNSAEVAIEEALVSGRRAMGNKSQSYFEIGQSLDAVLIDSQNELISQRSLNEVLSTYLYACDSTVHLGTIVNGKL